jgi:hypothetical protein
MWILTLTAYDDDEYKYNNGMYTQITKVFSNLDKARQYICKEVIKRIDSWDEEKMNKLGEDFINKHFKDPKSLNPELKQEYIYNFDVINEIHDVFFRGQFDEYTLTWNVSPVTINNLP